MKEYEKTLELLKSDNDMWDDICVDVKDHPNFVTALKLIDEGKGKSGLKVTENILLDVWDLEVRHRDRMGQLFTEEEHF